eukprot:CAMPEP_0117436466 /NCGR_PEP_ID=MMETSP0759-20121206/1021_1 /TAXON_ID=63605 /ORGANISM="Percolomonas cosmopolitus, Strain WS" /LENGTH=160 /DNA_ID=CAMNT_0005228065 /DNA_START=352 /DNA_END=834 /DNA_ORIENTATION=-
MKPIARRTLDDMNPKSPMVANDSCNLFVQKQAPRDEKEHLAILEIRNILNMRPENETPSRAPRSMYHNPDVSPPERFLSPPLRAANPLSLDRNFERDFSSSHVTEENAATASSTGKRNNVRVHNLAADEENDSHRRGLQIPTHRRNTDLGFQMSPPIQCS